MTSPKILDGTVKWDDLALNSVTSSRIKDASVNTADLIDGAATTPKLADNAVNGAKVLVLPQSPGAVTGTDSYIAHLDLVVTALARALGE